MSQNSQNTELAQPDYNKIAYDLNDAVNGLREPKTAHHILSGQDYTITVKDKNRELKNETRKGLGDNLEEFIRQNPNNYVGRAFNTALHKDDEQIITDFMAAAGFSHFVEIHSNDILSEIKTAFEKGNTYALNRLLDNDSVKNLIQKTANGDIFDIALAAQNSAEKHPETFAVIQQENVLSTRIGELTEKAERLKRLMNKSTQIRSPEKTAELGKINQTAIDNMLA